MTTTEKRPPTLTGSQDLLTYFNLIPIYNKVVKPYPPDNRSEGLDQSLFPYVSDLPGKNDMEYDGYLMNLLRDPQAVESGSEIKPLDAETLRDAFSLKEGPVPGFDASILGTDDAPNMGSSSSHHFGAESSHKSIADVDINGERKHKKKKKKRKHDHEHNEDGHHSDHKKKKKKKKDRERRDNFEDVVVD